MNLVRCGKGHFYDADKFETCPHCLQLMAHEENVTTPLYSSAKNLTEPLTEYQPQPSGGSAAPQHPAQTDAPVSDLKEEIQRSVSAAPQQDDAEKTVGYYASLIGIEPVVGWLVCIKGEYYGDQFRLKSGRNFIGRGADMDVVLSLDPKVSRVRHAVITYEPRSRTFYVQPGDARELFYLNDNVVLDNAVLKSNDILTIGDTKLMFVPFCTERFSWDDAKKEEEKA